MSSCVLTIVGDPVACGLSRVGPALPAAILPGAGGATLCTWNGLSRVQLLSIVGRESNDAYQITLSRIAFVNGYQVGSW